MTAPIQITRIVETLKLKYKTIITPSPYKLVVGSSGIHDQGWIASDIFGLNILKDSDWNFFFDKDSIQNIMGEHVWEHLTLKDGKVAAQHCFNYLKKGGILRIAVPDGFHACPNYINCVKPGGNGAGADDHKVLYNYQTLGEMLQNIGFEVKAVEYFDEQKQFNTSDWSLQHGKINRSLKFDHRNKDGKPNYTSLIVDAVKV